MKYKAKLLNVELIDFHSKIISVRKSKTSKSIYYTVLYQEKSINLRISDHKVYKTNLYTVIHPYPKKVSRLEVIQLAYMILKLKNHKKIRKKTACFSFEEFKSRLCYQI